MLMLLNYFNKQISAHCITSAIDYRFSHVNAINRYCNYNLLTSEGSKMIMFGNCIMRSMANA